MKKLIVFALIFILISVSSVYGFVDYKIEYGDTLWKISQKYNLSMNEIIQANSINNINNIVAGSKISLPELQNGDVLYKVKSGDSYWKISSLFGLSTSNVMNVNNSTYGYLEVGDVLYIPFNNLNQITYLIDYKVQSGDNVWSIANKFGVTTYDIQKVNYLSANQYLTIGQILKIPQHVIKERPRVSWKYGEYLDWWKEVQYLIPINSTFTVKDLQTGTTWNMKRTIGANHADCEPLTSKDTETMKNVWGGSYSWVTRPVLILFNGRQIAASVSGMPHDIQYITTNGVTGHFDIHFANSTRHKDGQRTEEHQLNVLKAAGLR